tara:strand:+ start:1018 stop:1461 length:444 start_codon:yes stop_codon:yes gene_type:complete
MQKSMSNALTSLQSFYCKPAVSMKYKNKIGLIAVKDIEPNTKVMERPCYNGQWMYTEDLKGKYDVDSSTINSLQELYRNKKLFMQNCNRRYTFIPTIPIYEYHGEMFINQSRYGSNVALRTNGYYTTKRIKRGDELLLLEGNKLLVK